MRTRLLAPALLLLAASVSAARAAETPPAAGGPPAPSIAEVSGIVADGASADGRIWFALSRMPTRFELATNAVANADPLFDALKKSSSSGRSVRVRFHVESGWFDPKTGSPTYAVQSIEYEGTAIPAQAAPPAPQSATRVERALLRGVGLGVAERYAEARAELDVALADEQLAPRLRALGHRMRGDAIYGAATDRVDAPEPELDRERVAALADFRSWAALAPVEAQAEYRTASVLADLGAYPDAIATLRRIAETWPDEDFWPAIRLGALLRLRGDYPGALAAVDTIPPSYRAGMAYRYHRGWTLALLGRPREAEAEFTAGLETQPDYAWALLQRACARAQQGDFDRALADQDAGLAQLRRGNDSPAALADRASASALRDELAAALARRERTPLANPCASYSTWRERERSRSPLLPPAEGAPAAAAGARTRPPG